MKKITAILASVVLLGIVSAQAEKEKNKPTAEQKALKKEITEKYDTNKDGKLDKEEKAKISAEDKERMEKAGLNHHKKDKTEDKKEDKK